MIIFQIEALTALHLNKYCMFTACIYIFMWKICSVENIKARIHRRFLLRSFSFWCMRLNGLTYECIRPSVQSYINQYFCDSTTQTHASEWEKSPQNAGLAVKSVKNVGLFHLICAPPVEEPWNSSGVAI